MNMTIIEFYEALCRVADKIPKENLPNFYPIHKSVSPYFIDKKIESLVIAMARNGLPVALGGSLEKKYATELELAFAGPK